MLACMDGKLISAEEEAEFREYQRSRREAEARRIIGRLVLSAFSRGTDKNALKSTCALAKKLGAHGVLVSPVNVAAARRYLAGSAQIVCAVVGGTGESLACIKRAEARKAKRQGAREIALVPSGCALSCEPSSLRRELKRVVRAVRGCGVSLLLFDEGISSEQLSRGAALARACGLSSVCVQAERVQREDMQLLCGEGIFFDVAGAESAELACELVRMGARRLYTTCAERVSERLLAKARQDLAGTSGE